VPVCGVIYRKDGLFRLRLVVEKSSAGALAYIPVARVVNLNTAIGKIKEHGYWVFGLSLEGKSSYTDVDLTGPVCIVAGSEGEGLRPLVEKNCDFTIKLPVMGRINSLNVSVACGIVLYESLRQRKIKPDKKGKITLNS
jgi:23S rRNA (guanosine2251-2'-O)-methyltransferase